MTKKPRKSISWYRYRLEDRLTGAVTYWGNSLAMADHLGFKSTSPLQAYLRGQCKGSTAHTKDRWARFRITRCFVPNWKDGNRYTIKRKLRQIKRAVREELVASVSSDA